MDKPLNPDADVQQFRELLAQARGQFVLDGDYDRAPDFGYAAVGKFVVRQCDLLIAIWDGIENPGSVGTEATLRYAASSGVPAIWLSTQEDAPLRWLIGPGSIGARETAPHAAGQLAPYLRRLLLPPRSPRLRRPHHLSVFDRIGLILGWCAGLPRRCLAIVRGRQPRRVAPLLPLSRLLAEVTPGVGGLWATYEWVLRRIAREPPQLPAPAQTSPAGAPGTLTEWWAVRYSRMDALASAYAARSRSVAMLVLILAAGAVSLGALADALAGLELPAGLAQAAIGLDLAALAALSGLILIARTLGWQERSVGYRLLAELCRSQAALAPLGRALPIDVEGNGEGAWVPWLFASWQRAAPLPVGTLDSDAVAAARTTLEHTLLGSQWLYHRKRRLRMHRAEGLLRCVGETMFFFVIAVVAVKTYLGPAMWHGGAGVLFGLLATVLPALSAAALGLRAHDEMELLASQSHRIQQVLARAWGRIGRLDLTAPPASERLGTVGVQLAELLLEETDGWAELFELKTVESG